MFRPMGSIFLSVATISDVCTEYRSPRRFFLVRSWSEPPDCGDMGISTSLSPNPALCPSHTPQPLSTLQPLAWIPGSPPQSQSLPQFSPQALLNFHFRPPSLTLPDLSPYPKFPTSIPHPSRFPPIPGFSQPLAVFSQNPLRTPSTTSPKTCTVHTSYPKAEFPRRKDAEL